MKCVLMVIHQEFYEASNSLPDQTTVVGLTKNCTTLHRPFHVSLTPDTLLFTARIGLTRQLRFSHEVTARRSRFPLLCLYKSSKMEFDIRLLASADGLHPGASLDIDMEVWTQSAPVQFSMQLQTMLQIVHQDKKSKFFVSEQNTIFQQTLNQAKKVHFLNCRCSMENGHCTGIQCVVEIDGKKVEMVSQTVLLFYADETLVRKLPLTCEVA